MSWIRIEDQPPPSFQKLLVVKYYTDNEFDMKNGGCTDKVIKLPSFIDVDEHVGITHGWMRGGVVTHWMPLPEMPISSQPYEKI